MCSPMMMNRGGYMSGDGAWDVTPRIDPEIERQKRLTKERDALMRQNLIGVYLMIAAILCAGVLILGSL